MRSTKFFICAVGVALVVLTGFATSRFFTVSEAQTAKKETAWQHAEIPLLPVNSKFRLNLPEFQASDWIVGVKPVKEGEKERMHVGIFTWADADGESAKKMGFIQLVKMEDYPQTAARFGSGEATLLTPLASNQTLVVYMEVNPSTQTIFQANGKEYSSPSADSSFIMFNGEIEKAQIENVATLMGVTNVKILKKSIAAKTNAKEAQ